MVNRLFQDCFRRNFTMASGVYCVEVWSVPEGLDLEVTLPSAEVVPCRFAQGKLTSRFIEAVKRRGVHADLTMMESISKTLSPEVREVALKAMNEFLVQT